MTSPLARSAPPAASPLVVLCDVNETLLDMRPLKRAVVKAFGSPHAFQQWFGLVQQYALVDTVGGTYHDFGLIGDAALDMAAAMLEEKPLKPAKKREILALLTELPPHPDVADGLRCLLDAGFRLAAFTQASQPTLDAQLRYAGLIGYFEQGISVADIGRFKPHPATYRYAAGRMGVAPAQAMLLAAHGWDVAGALRAGLRAGFVARPGQARYPLAPPPTYEAPTLLALARQLAPAYHGSAY